MRGVRAREREVESETEGTAVSQQLQFKLPLSPLTHAATGTARSVVACVTSLRKKDYSDDALRTGNGPALISLVPKLFSY